MNIERRQKTVWAAVIAACAVVILGTTWVLVFGPDGDEESKAQSAPTTTSGSTNENPAASPAGSKPTVGADGKCAPQEWDATTTSFPAEWVIAEYGILVPVSEQYGPVTRAEGQPWRCWQRSPAGAIMAAWTIDQRSTYINNVDQYTPEATRAKRREAYAKVDVDALAATTTGDPIGWRITDATPDAVSMVLFARITLTENSEMVTGSCSYDVRWIDNDWQIFAPNATITCNYTNSSSVPVSGDTLWPALPARGDLKNAYA